MLNYVLFILLLSFSFSSYAQVQVRDEPRHHNVFENEMVRILDVHLGPGDTTLYHLHNTPSVFILFTNTNVGSQLIGQQPAKGANISGDVSYDSISTPRTHRVWNEDTGWFHVMDVELTSTKQKITIPVLQIPSLQLLFNKQEVNGYTINLTVGKVIDLPASPQGYLIIAQTGKRIDFTLNAITQQRMLQPGHYIWVEAGKKISRRTKDQDARFVLLQLK